MKHLRTFNESVTNEELQEFCEINLAYLIDYGAEVICKQQLFGKIRIKFNNPSNWDDIKDHIIPFAIRLNNKYEVEYDKDCDVRIFTTPSSNMGFGERIYGRKIIWYEVFFGVIVKIEDLINDNIKVLQIEDIYI